MGQQIVHGVASLDSILASLHARKVLLVVDSSFPFLSIRESVLASLRMPYVMFNGFSPNPLYEDVCNGVSLFHQEGCDVIVAVGGGSSIDVAKCIKLYCRMDPSVNYLEQECFDTEVPLVAIPTTAGTGSESTRFAVIYYKGEKQSVNHLSIIPNYAVLDSTVLSTLPSYQKRCTVFDALCQSIESWWSVNATEESQHISAKALQLLHANIEEYLFLNSHEAAAHVMVGSNMAGQAINLTQTTAPHAFSYKVTSLYNLPHGHAVAVCMPEIWDYMICNIEKCIDSRGVSYLRNVMQSISSAMGVASPGEAVVEFRRLQVASGLLNPVSQNKILDLDILTHSVNPVRMKNHPVALDMDAIAFLYDKIVK